MQADRSHPDRRHFLKRSLWGLGLGMSWPTLLAAAVEGPRRTPHARLQETRVIVFQGDSITDAGRNKEDQAPNQSHSLGNGYVGVTVAELLGKNPGSPWQCYNRGISGNKVFQLAERWQQDCLDLKPDVLSILIGVNDYWHTLKHSYNGTVEIYERDYRALLDRTKKALPNVKLILGEPFALAGGSAIEDGWYPDFNEYRAAAKRVADAYKAVWIPYQSLFDAALKKAPVAYWSPDGVHPGPAGNYLMAQAWLKAFEATR